MWAQKDFGKFAILFIHDDLFAIGKNHFFGWFILIPFFIWFVSILNVVSFIKDSPATLTPEGI